MLHLKIHSSNPAAVRLMGGQVRAGQLIRRALTILLCVVAAACSAPGNKKSAQIDPRLGVAPSPRVVEKGQPIPKGGGREMVGKPYVIAGRVYIPTADPRGLSQTGLASWYGDDFHGRYTANGEIYDMNHLSAAHPTMPLPSYARVTSLATGRSVVVRVNDRGPYHSNRIMDLSGGAARLLGVARLGVSKIKVDYLGRAPLSGNDMAYLQSTYLGPGASFEAPNNGLAGNIPILGPILGKVFVPQPTAGFTPPPLRTGSITSAPTFNPAPSLNPATSFADNTTDGADGAFAPEASAPQATASLPSTIGSTSMEAPNVEAASLLTPAPLGAVLPVERPHIALARAGSVDAYDAFVGRTSAVAATNDVSAPVVLPVPRPSQLDQTYRVPAHSGKASSETSLLSQPTDASHAYAFAPSTVVVKDAFPEN